MINKKQKVIHLLMKEFKLTEQVVLQLLDEGVLQILVASDLSATRIFNMLRGTVLHKIKGRIINASFRVDDETDIKLLEFNFEEIQKCEMRRLQDLLTAEENEELMKVQNDGNMEFVKALADGYVAEELLELARELIQQYRMEHDSEEELDTGMEL